MEFRIFDDMGQCTQQEVERLLKVVSLQRRNQALKFKFLFGQFACLKSYEMLMQLLGRTDDMNIDFQYNEHGKPYLPDERYFSISHCKQGIAVAIDDNPIGIDIESIRDADDSLIRYTMNEEETRQILSSVNRSEAFITLWTKKEALLKMRGTGITDEIKNVLTTAGHIETIVNPEKGYVVSIATEANS